MNTLSTRTLGRLVTAAGAHLSKTSLRDLLMQSGLYDLDGFDPADLVSRGASADPPRGDILRPPLLAACRLAGGENRDAHEALLEMVRSTVEALYGYPQARETLPALQEALISDGYEIQWDAQNLLPGDYSRKCRLLPIDPDAIPVSTEITALEADLDKRGYTETSEHYREAIKHFNDQEHPSANGALRKMIESLVKHLAIDHTGYTDSGIASQGGAAISTLYTAGKPPAVQGQPLPENDGGRMLHGIWQILHPGAHAGLSDADEARIRMQLCTALARFLLKHFPAKP